jgi:hypothetical protein
VQDIRLRIELATEPDTPVVLRVIKALADHERLTQEFTS